MVRARVEAEWKEMSRQTDEVQKFTLLNVELRGL